MQPVSKKTKPCRCATGFVKNLQLFMGSLKMAPVTGLEPVTHRLTADCATIAPHRNGVNFYLKVLKISPVLTYCQVELKFFLPNRKGIY